MSWAMVAGAAITAVGGAVSSRNARKGASKGVDAQMAGIEEQRRQFDLSREDMLPWMEAGRNALGQMQALNAGDFSSFTQSPDYQFALEQGMKALDRSAAARGRLYSGGYGEDLTRFGQGLATQNYNNYYNRLAGLSGTGQTSATNLGSLGAQMAGNIQAGYGNIGNIRQSAYNDQANIWGNVANQFAGGLGQWYGNNSARNGGGTGWYFGNNPGKG